jgi:hypothetical protein
MPLLRRPGRAPRTQPEVTTPASGVNDPDPLAHPETVQVHRFTPYHHLCALVADPRRLSLSPGARTVLGVALWRAGKAGEGEGTREGEAMFVRRVATGDPEHRRNTLVGDTRGMSKWACQQAIVELCGAGLLRTRTVRPLERLPRLPGGGGAGRRVDPALGSVTVFWVAIARLKALLSGDGTLLAMKAVSQPSRKLCESHLTTKNPNDLGAPCGKIDTDQAFEDPVVNRRTLTNNHNHRVARPPTERARAHGTPPNPPPGGGGDSEISRDDVAAVFDAWWRLVGRPRAHVETPPPRTVRSVQRAIAGALADGYTRTQLSTVVAARADRRIGGRAWEWCETRARTAPIWGAALFGGPVDELLAAAASYENRQRRAAEDPPRAVRGEGDPPEPSGEPTRSRAVQRNADELRKLLGVDPDPPWLQERPSPTWGKPVGDDERAAFRPPRRR